LKEALVEKYNKDQKQYCGEHKPTYGTKIFYGNGVIEKNI